MLEPNSERSTASVQAAGVRLNHRSEGVLGDGSNLDWDYHQGVDYEDDQKHGEFGRGIYPDGPRTLLMQATKERTERVLDNCGEALTVFGCNRASSFSRTSCNLECFSRSLHGYVAKPITDKEA